MTKPIDRCTPDEIAREDAAHTVKCEAAWVAVWDKFTDFAVKDGYLYSPNAYVREGKSTVVTDRRVVRGTVPRSGKCPVDQVLTGCRGVAGPAGLAWQ